MLRPKSGEPIDLDEGNIAPDSFPTIGRHLPAGPAASETMVGRSEGEIVSLDEAERRALEEIERQLASEDPHLVLPPTRGGGVLAWLQAIPVTVATLVFLTATSWLAVQAGDVIPMVLALPVAGTVAMLLWWQHRDRRLALPDHSDAGRPSSSSNSVPPADAPPWQAT